MSKPYYDDGVVQIWNSDCLEVLPTLADKSIDHVITLFWRKADRSGECWVWTAARDKNGYGKFQITQRPGPWPKQMHVRAHRFAFLIANGRMPQGLILHACDTPSCVRPAHLREGTQSENIREMDARGRRGTVPIERKARGSRHGMAKLTEQAVREIRQRAAAGERFVDIARAYGVHQYRVSDVVHGRAWKHVPLEQARKPEQSALSFEETGS